MDSTPNNSKPAESSFDYSCVIALLAAVCLWTLGLMPPFLHPLWMSIVLLAAVIAGLASSAVALAGKSSRSRLAWVPGCVGLGAAVLFLLVLFHKTEGSAVVTRRVSLSESPVKQLRVVNFNVLHGYPRFRGQESRLAHLVAALKHLEPTVLVLQEAWSVTGHGQLAARLSNKLELDVAYAVANGSQRLIGFEEGAAVLSRLPILEARRIRLGPRRPFWENRIALLATLDLGNDERLLVAGVHLAHGSTKVAAAQAANLASQLPTAGFVIVAGDLNAPSDSAVTHALTALGLDDAVPGGIDHVFVGGLGDSWAIERADWTLRPQDLAQLIGEQAEISDHPGIVVDLARRP